MDMEEKIPQEPDTPEVQAAPEGYKPRPTWQVWLARIGLVVFIAFLIVYYMIYFRGGR